MSAAGGFFESILLVLLLFSGSSDLEEVLEVETYWRDLGIGITVPNMMKELTAPAPPGKELAEWVEQLGAAEFAQREEASRRIRETGPPARGLLEEAATSSDPEVRMRARELLNSLPEKLPGQDHERARMAFVALSRMEDPEAQKRLLQLEQQKGPPAEMAQRMWSHRRTRIEELKTVLNRIPPEAEWKVQFQKRAKEPDTDVLTAVRRSPAIQQILLDLWGRVGDVRILRVTAWGTPGLLTDPMQGQGTMLLEGIFEKDKLEKLLRRTGFSSSEDPQHWKQGPFRVTFLAEENQILIEYNGDEDLDPLLLAEEAGSPSVLQPRIPGTLLWAEAGLSEVPEGIPGLPVQPDSVSLEVTRTEAGLKFYVLAPCVNPEGAMRLKEHQQSELDQVKQLLGKENDPELLPFGPMMEAVEIHAEGKNVQIRMTLSTEVQVQVIQSLERMLSMIRGIHQQNDVLLH